MIIDSLFLYCHYCLRNYCKFSIKTRHSSIAAIFFIHNRNIVLNDFRYDEYEVVIDNNPFKAFGPIYSSSASSGGGVNGSFNTC